MRSSQEEANTCMLLHALHAAESGYKAAIIIADDTDVLVLSLGFSKDIPCPVYKKCGTQNRTRFLDITKLCQSLGESVAGTLIGMHAFTGCDTVSTFAGREKMGTFKQLKSDRTYQEAFLELGCAWTVSDELFKNLQEITCHIYVPSTHTTDVNLLRYQLFCTRCEGGRVQPASTMSGLLIYAFSSCQLSGCYLERVSSNPAICTKSQVTWMDHK